MNFKPAQLDRTATLITIITVMILTAMAVFLAIKIPGRITAPLILFLPAILVACFLWSTRGFRFEGGNLVIEKMIGLKTVIALKEIEHFALVEDFCRFKPVRIFGNGGLFGYYGIFATAEHGAVSCFLTRLKDVVMIQTRDRTYALTPAATAEFMAALRAAVPSPAAEVESLPALLNIGRRPASLLILLIPDTILTLTVVLALVCYSRLPAVIATHFNTRGMANGWSTKGSFLLFGLLPAFVIFGINLLIFFTVRKRISDRRVTYFITGLFSLIQLLFLYIMLDIYSFNVHQQHIIPMEYVFYLFFGLIALGFFLYWGMIRKPR